MALTTGLTTTNQPALSTHYYDVLIDTFSWTFCILWIWFWF